MFQNYEQAGRTVLISAHPVHSKPLIIMGSQAILNCTTKEQSQTFVNCADGSDRLEVDWYCIRVRFIQNIEVDFVKNCYLLVHPYFNLE